MITLDLLNPLMKVINRSFCVIDERVLMNEILVYLFEIELSVLLMLLSLIQTAYIISSVRHDRTIVLILLKSLRLLILFLFILLLIEFFSKCFTKSFGHL